MLPTRRTGDPLLARSQLEVPFGTSKLFDP